jgi:hypothetical protein
LRGDTRRITGAREKLEFEQGSGESDVSERLFRFFNQMAESRDPGVINLLTVGAFKSMTDDEMLKSKLSRRARAMFEKVMREETWERGDLDDF